MKSLRPEKNFNYITNSLILLSVIILVIVMGIVSLIEGEFLQIQRLLFSIVGISMIILSIVMTVAKRIILKIMHVIQSLFNLISVLSHWVYGIISAIIIILFVGTPTWSILDLFAIIFLFIALCLAIDIIVNIVLHVVDDYIFD
ncbi:MAG: hypothetical protein ACTSR8_14510 [Promethearchaeota archaeon]